MRRRAVLFQIVLTGDLLLVGEETLVETLEALAVAGFILGHFMHGVVDGVVAELLGAAGDAHLVFIGTGLGSHALLEVGLGVPHTFAEELGKLGGVLSLLEGVALEGLGDFGVALAVGLTRHGEIHAHFATLAVEMGGEVVDHLLVLALGAAHLMLGHKHELGGLVEFLELGSGSTADGALFGSFVPFVYIAAHSADKFLLHFGCRNVILSLQKES